MRRVIKRMKRPTPRYFKKPRNTGLFLSAMRGVVFAVPVGFAGCSNTGSRIPAVAGTIASAVSQAAVIYTEVK